MSLDRMDLLPHAGREYTVDRGGLSLYHGACKVLSVDNDVGNRVQRFAKNERTASIVRAASKTLYGRRVQPLSDSVNS
jgi:hypothetical protein